MKLFDAGSIIVNKKKLEALKLILPAETANLQPAQDNKPRLEQSLTNYLTNLSSGERFSLDSSLNSCTNCTNVLCRRLVVPPGTGGIARRVVTGGIKNRIGKLGQLQLALFSLGLSPFFLSPHKLIIPD